MRGTNTDASEDVEKRQGLHDANENLEDFEWALGLNRLVLRPMGIWPGDKEEQGFRRLTVLLRAPCMIGALFFCLFIPQICALTKVIGLMPLVIDNVMECSPVVISCVKLFFMWRRKPALRPVVQSITQDWLRPKLSWEREAMIREASRARIFTVSSYVITTGCYAGFAFSPLFGISIRILSNITDYGSRHLLLQTYYPYDYSESPYYEITYTFQLIACSFIALSASIPDNYFAALTFHLSAQFEILGINMQNSILKEKLDINQFKEKIGHFVDRHVQLMTLVKIVETSFSFVIMGQMFCMSIMVCCIGFQVMNFAQGSEGQSSVIQLITLCGTLFTQLLHTLADCFVSETLTLRSSGIYHNIYNSKWYTALQQSRQDVMLIMLASKNPRKLTAGKLFTLSLQTYCSLLKSTAGYISMLIAVNKR